MHLIIFAKNLSLIVKTKSLCFMCNRVEIRRSSTTRRKVKSFMHSVSVHTYPKKDTFYMITSKRLLLVIRVVHAACKCNLWLHLHKFAAPIIAGRMQNTILQETRLCHTACVYFLF